MSLFLPTWRMILASSRYGWSINCYDLKSQPHLGLSWNVFIENERYFLTEHNLANTKPRQYLESAAFLLHFGLGLLVKVCSYLASLHDAVLLYAMSAEEILNHRAMSVKKVKQWEDHLRSKSTYCKSETAIKSICMVSSKWGDFTGYIQLELTRLLPTIGCIWRSGCSTCEHIPAIAVCWGGS